MNAPLYFAFIFSFIQIFSQLSTAGTYKIDDKKCAYSKLILSLSKFWLNKKEYI